MRWFLGVAVCIGVSCAMSIHSSNAETAPDGKRRLSVLEYRSGSVVLPDIGERVAGILRQKTSLSVIDPEDARQAFGRHLDRRVAKCAGDARCIARIGRTIGADEVLLIGVSRFGDDIVTIQRIEVDARRVLARVADALAPGQEPDEGALLSYLRQVLPKSDFIRYGVIRIESNLDDAVVVIGGLERGKTPLEPQRVRAPASYEIEVRSSGYTPFRASVDVPPDAVVRVQTSLSRRKAASWYKRWWVVALVGGAVVGTLTTVALTRDSPSDIPVVIRF